MNDRGDIGAPCDTRFFDGVIAGGGLSGLSLAAHLARHGWRDRSILVIDDATARPAAMCWGFWSATPGLLDAAVCRTYQRVRIHAAGVSRLLDLGPYRYHMVRRPDLTTAVRTILDGCPNALIRHGHVGQMVDDEDGASVRVTVDDQVIRGGWAFDSVTASRRVGPTDAMMAFSGWEVRCDRGVFDQDTPVLFDFRTQQTGGPRFVYVLPENPYQALVEVTEFVPRSMLPPTRADLDEAVVRYLSDVVCCGDYQVLRTESAVLPLATRSPDRRSGRTLAIGSAAGLVKASTGYAFQRIQRDSAQIAASLARHGHPFDLAAHRPRHRLMDAILLEVLDREPAQMELAFASLFSAHPAERVLRFLDEDSGIADDVRLAASLSPAPYLGAVLRHVVSRPASWRAARGTSRRVS